MGIPGVEYFAHPWVLGPRFAKEVLFTGGRFTAERAYQLGMVNRVVPRAELETATFALAEQVAEMPPFGLALAKRAVNQCEDLMGMRSGMDSVFGLHHVAHAHNAEVSGDSLAGLDGRGMKRPPVTGADLGWSPPGPALTGAFRAEVRDWLAAHVPAEPLPSLDTAEGFARHREWERELAAARLSVVSWPARLRRPGRDAGRSGWSSRRSTTRPAPGPGGPERAVAARPDAVRARHRRPAGPAPAADGHRRRRCGRRPGPNPRRAATWPRSGLGRCAARAAGCCRAPRRGARGRRSRTGRSACSAPTPESRNAPAGLSGYLLFGLRAPGVTVRPIRQLGGRTGFAEIFLDDVFVPDADVVGAPGDGWRIAMSTASHERGLSLRSPGRFLAAAARLAELWRRAGDPDDTALRDRVADAWIGARAYQLHTQATAERLAAGGTLGLEPRPAWARCSGPSSTSRCTRRRSTCWARTPRSATARTGAGWRTTCSRWRARSTRAPTRSSAR